MLKSTPTRQLETLALKHRKNFRVVPGGPKLRFIIPNKVKETDVRRASAGTGKVCLSTNSKRTEVTWKCY